MPGSDQTDATTEAAGQQQELSESAEKGQTKFASQAPVSAREDQAHFPAHAAEGTRNRLDWIAIGSVVLIAAFFPIVARLNPQPPNSLTPIAVLSATGCGLLITALRKLRTPKRPGLLEAAIGGFFLALFPFLAAITAPNVLAALGTSADEMRGFMTTWALILVFSLLFSIIGATLGHLAFAPLRPLPTKPQEASVTPLPETEGTEEVEDENSATEEEGGEEAANVVGLPLAGGLESSTEEGGSEEVADEENAPATEAPRSLLSYLVAVFLFGLLPTIAGYVFSAAFDFMLKVYQFFPGPYPTLRLLSGLLPWQLPVSLGSSGSGVLSGVFLEWQFWRIPLFLGNPTTFDLVALEPYILNAAALALLLLAAHRFVSHAQRETSLSPAVWPTYLLFEVVLGLLIVLPAALWIIRGLQGLLQLPNLVIPIRTLYLLNPLTFTLNLITGPLVCLLVAILLRLFLTRNRVPERNS